MRSEARSNRYISIIGWFTIVYCVGKVGCNISDEIAYGSAFMRCEVIACCQGAKERRAIVYIIIVMIRNCHASIAAQDKSFPPVCPELVVWTHRCYTITSIRVTGWCPK